MFKLARVGVILAQTVAQAGSRQALFCKLAAAHQAAVVQLELLETAVAQVAAVVSTSMPAVAVQAVIQALVAQAAAATAAVQEPNLLLAQAEQEAAAVALVAHGVEQAAAELAY